MEWGINYTAWPEMLAWPYLLINGFLPYKDIAIAHNPLLLLDLFIFYKIFGVGILQLKIYTWVLIALNTLLTFFVTKSIWDRKTGYLSSIIYLLLVIIFEGYGLWFDIALTPFALLLFYYLKNINIEKTNKKEYLIIGIIFALGFLTKQTFIYFSLPIILFILKNKKEIVSKFVYFVLGLLAIFTPFIVILSFFGILDDYYKWAIDFGILYLPKAIGQIQYPDLKQLIFVAMFFIPLILVKDLWLVIFSIVGALGVYPRWELFHFQPALPFLVLSFSLLVFDKKLNKLIKFFLIILFLALLILGFKRQVGVNTRFFENDVKQVVDKINNLEINNKTLYVINYWDNLYALTNTLPPKPLIPYIPWYLSYENNFEIILNNLKANMVDVIVIGKREIGNNNQIFNLGEIYNFVDKYYSCTLVEKEVELCIKNK